MTATVVHTCGSQRVLVCGMAQAYGGIEAVIIQVFRNLQRRASNTPDSRANLPQGSPTPPRTFCFDFLTFFDECAYENELVALGARVFHVTRRGEDPAKSSRELKAFFEEHGFDYDAIWFNLASASNCEPLILARTYTHARLIVHAHTTGFESRGGVVHLAHNLLHRANRRKLISCTDVKLACSCSAAEWLYGPAASDAIIIPNGIDTARFAFCPEARFLLREELGLPRDAIVLGTVGRLCAVKNQTFLLDVFASFMKVVPTSRLLIVGEGELKEELIARAQALGVGNNVVFAGRRDDIPACLAAMDAFCLPSLAEGFPVSLVEAQASGLPCFVSSAASREVALTPLVEFLDRAAGAQEWADCIKGKLCVSDGHALEKRARFVDSIRKYGYDTHDMLVAISRALSGITDDEK